MMSMMMTTSLKPRVKSMFQEEEDTMMTMIATSLQPRMRSSCQEEEDDQREETTTRMPQMPLPLPLPLPLAPVLLAYSSAAVTDEASVVLITTPPSSFSAKINKALSILSPHNGEGDEHEDDGTVQIDDADNDDDDDTDDVVHTFHISHNN